MLNFFKKHKKPYITYICKINIVKDLREMRSSGLLLHKNNLKEFYILINDYDYFNLLNKKEYMNLYEYIQNKYYRDRIIKIEKKKSKKTISELIHANEHYFKINKKNNVVSHYVS